MDTFVARLLQPALLILAIVVAALILLTLTVAVNVTLGAGHDVEPLVGPFRWQPTDSFSA
jgi:hypothetical protein